MLFFLLESTSINAINMMSLSVVDEFMVVFRFRIVR